MIKCCGRPTSPVFYEKYFTFSYTVHLAQFSVSTGILLVLLGRTGITDITEDQQVFQSSKNSFYVMFEQSSSLCLKVRM